MKKPAKKMPAKAGKKMPPWMGKESAAEEKREGGKMPAFKKGGSVKGKC